jgi:hypothetical protein
MGKLLDQLPAQLSAQFPAPDLTDEPAVAFGAALRALRVLLADLDRNRTSGGLNVVTTATHDVLWVCPIHYPIYVPPRPVLPAAASPPAHRSNGPARRCPAPRLGYACADNGSTEAVNLLIKSAWNGRLGSASLVGHPRRTAGGATTGRSRPSWQGSHSRA